jgi:PST family polysaccharide transporter
MGLSILFTSANRVQTGILNAYHRVGALAKCAVITTVSTGLVTIPAVLIWRRNGIAPAVIGGAVAGWLASRYFLRRNVDPLRLRSETGDRFKAAWELLRFGGPFTASMLIGTGAQLALPMVVLHLLGTESVGYYRAAMAISVGYMGFLITAMGQDYYPRVSAVRDQPAELVKLINEQHRLIMLLAVPMILGTLALVPFLVPLVYSHKFTPTIEILEWQLIGDIFKFSGWTMSFAILARCSTPIYFLAESIGGVSILLSTWLAVHFFGLPGLGIGFLFTYVIYYLAVWLIIRREVPLVWTRNNKKMMAVAILSGVLVRVLPATRFASWRTPVALALAVIIGVFSLLTLWREFMSAKESESDNQLVKETKSTYATTQV